MTTPVPLRSKRSARLSVVIPMYNAGSVIEASIGELLSYFRGRRQDDYRDGASGVELILVDDGSTDDTPEIVERAIQNEATVRLIRYQPNRGKGHAVRMGVTAAVGEFVVFTDADLAYPPSQINKILGALIEGADVVVANRASQDTRFVMSPNIFSYLYTRHIASRLFNTVARQLLDIGIRDTQAGLKGFRREAATAILSRQRIIGFAFDLELLHIASRLGLRVVDVPILYRYFSEPTTVRLVEDGARALRDMLRIRRNGTKGYYDAVPASRDEP